MNTDQLKVADIYLTQATDLLEPRSSVVLVAGGTPVIGSNLVIRPTQGTVIPFNDAALTRKLVDGSFLLKLMGDWISVAEAATLMACSEASVGRILEMTKPDGKPILEWRRPTFGRFQIRLSSVLEHLKITATDPEFWRLCTPIAKPMQPLGK